MLRIELNGFFHPIWKVHNKFTIIGLLWRSMCAQVARWPLVFVADMIDFTAHQLSIISVTKINPTTDLAILTSSYHSRFYLYLWEYSGFVALVPWLWNEYPSICSLWALDENIVFNSPFCFYCENMFFSGQRLSSELDNWLANANATHTPAKAIIAP